MSVHWHFVCAFVSSTRWYVNQLTLNLLSSMCLCVQVCVYVWLWNGIEDCTTTYTDNVTAIRCCFHSNCVYCDFCMFVHSQISYESNISSELLWFCNIQWKAIAASLLSINYELNLRICSAIYWQTINHFLKTHSHNFQKLHVYVCFSFLFWY